MAEIERQFSNARQRFSAFALQMPAMATSFSDENNMADLLGQSPNLLDDLFKDLEDWEAVLSSLPDFGVDQNQN
jgi:hypothetical protein